MDLTYAACKLLLFFLLVFCTSYPCCATGINADQTAWLSVNVSENPPRKIPKTMFGISFEEINHAGAGGLWAELVSNRGFEAGGQNTPSNISPWSILGDESLIFVSTDRSSCFDRNRIALRMEVLCNTDGGNICPAAGVGVYNPGFWGMNIEQGKTYKVTFYVRSLQPIELSVSLIGSNGLQKLATADIIDDNVTNWTKKDILLQAAGTDPNSRLQLTTRKKGTIWLDQVSAMPLSTHKDILDAIEFARGDPTSTWGSVRAEMGHAEPFDLRYVAVGNQDCGNKNYRGNYMKFYTAIKGAYPDIKIISNCDGSTRQLDHPADLYDFHVYTNANSMFSMAHNFDHTSRSGPKVVNFGSNRVSLKVSVDGLDKNSIEAAGSTITMLMSSNAMAENSFSEPKKVAPTTSQLENASNRMNVVLAPYSLTSIDLLRKSNIVQVAGCNTDLCTSL
ncbi:UNVERIFIED_CONTAM: Alpha-L-arabinofuranosidase 1 [Sesamum angustifolium]|uniref:Alpha-L-arabinofuranosidase 1 n=1 Tax=Sesamum angustifolium TaxID=2727405 RepID=A0AAW2II87_9LAMI